MRKLLIATKESLKRHAGQEVDDYLTVEPVLMPDEMPAAANLIRNKIRQIVIDAKRETNEDVMKVFIECDATPPWRVMLVSLAETMQKEEQLDVELTEDFNMGKRDEKVNLE